MTRPTTEVVQEALKAAACGDGEGARTESSMRPHCQIVDACAAKGNGHCRRCWGLHLKRVASAPEIEARRIERVTQRSSETSKARWQDPAYRARMTEIARERGALTSPNAIARRDAPETRRKLEENRIATVRAMTPEERRRKYGAGKGYCHGLTASELDLYRQLMLKRIPAAQARAMVEETSRAEVRRKVGGAR